MELGLDLVEVARDATAAVFSAIGSGLGLGGGACENIDWTVDAAVGAAALFVGATALRQSQPSAHSRAHAAAAKRVCRD